MANKVVCMNCGKEMKGINAAKNDGWIVEDNELFCCCVCRGEYNSKKKSRKK